jgi:hypothetical protein
LASSNTRASGVPPQWIRCDAQRFERTVDRVALGNATKIDAQPLERPGGVRLEELECIEPARRSGQTRVEGAVRSGVQLAAELQHLPGPGVQFDPRAGSCAIQLREAAAGAFGMHDTLDRDDRVPGRGDRLLGDWWRVRLRFDGDECAERHSQPRDGIGPRIAGVRRCGSHLRK